MECWGSGLASLWWVPCIFSWSWLRGSSSLKKQRKVHLRVLNTRISINDFGDKSALVFLINIRHIYWMPFLLGGEEEIHSKFTLNFSLDSFIFFPSPFFLFTHILIPSKPPFLSISSGFHHLYNTVLGNDKYRIVLYWIVLYFIVFYFIVLYCIVLYCIISSFILYLICIVLYFILYCRSYEWVGEMVWLNILLQVRQN